MVKIYGYCTKIRKVENMVEKNRMEWNGADGEANKGLMIV